ncbi:hypothetical protein RQP46_007161 [Phenoliferia psychrophenolica]
MAASDSSLDEEKPSFAHVEGSKDLEGAHSVDAAEDARIMWGPRLPPSNVTADLQSRRKVDWRLIPILSILYSVSLIDRVFFASYIVFEFPSNILLRKLGARNHMTAIVISWGAVVGMGFTTDWIQMVVLRVLLGVFEAGFFPACLFLITCTRAELQPDAQRDTDVVRAGADMSNCRGYGISTLDGQHGLEGWRWIFVVYGAFTIGLGMIGFFLIVDFPDKSTFLAPDELKVVLDRINLDRGDAESDALTFRRALEHACDFKIWCFGIIFSAGAVTGYAFSFFLPVILRGAGYSARLSLILSAPPYIFATIWMGISATIADRKRKRAVFLIFNNTICILGLILLGWGKLTGVRMLGCFLALAGCQANVPTAASYQANNIVSHSKRAVSSAVFVAWGGIGGIVASMIFRQVDYPYCISGTMAFQASSIVIVSGLSLHFKRQNKLADEGKIVIEGQPGFSPNVTRGARQGEYLTKSISIYASFEGHANFPPIASVVSELEGALDHLLPVSALLANIESEVGAILSMVGHVVGQVDLPLPTVSATGVLNVGPSP